MNVSASGLSKILLQVIPRDFSKFSPVKILPFFQRSRSPLSHPLSVAAQAEMAGATYSGQLHRAGLWCLRNYGYGPG
jgi:hypothetical protein